MIERLRNAETNLADFAPATQMLGLVLKVGIGWPGLDRREAAVARHLGFASVHLRPPYCYRIEVSKQILVVAITMTLIGCQRNMPQSAPALQYPAKTAIVSEASVGPDSVTTFPYEVTDGLGRKVILAKVPARIVSLSPKNTEMLFAVGAGDSVIGTTTYCNYPPAAVKTEKVGGFSAKSLSLERIVSLKPDLVFSAGNLHASIVQEIERLQIPVIASTADSFEGLFADLQMAGRITGHDRGAATLVKRLIERVERVKQKAKTIPAVERVSAFYYVWGDPLMGAGPSSYFGEMIQFCGAVNVVEDVTNLFPKMTMEVLLAKNPDVIISSSNHSDLASNEAVLSRPGWNQLKAVQTKRLHLLDGDLVSRCTPRTVDALDQMAYLLYPAYFDLPENGLRDDQANGQQP